MLQKQGFKKYPAPNNGSLEDDLGFYWKVTDLPLFTKNIKFFFVIVKSAFWFENCNVAVAAGYFLNKKTWLIPDKPLRTC